MMRPSALTLGGSGAMRGKRAELLGWATVGSMALLVGIAPPSLAQDQGIVPVGEYREGLVVGDWKLYPKIFVGAVWDTNIDQQASGAEPGAERTSRTSARAVPYLSGFYDGGIHKTSVYGVVDARFFDATNLSATTGLTHRYEAMRDLIFNYYVNYTRQTDLFTNALNFNNGAIGPNISGTPETNIPIVLNPFGTTPSVNPSAYNQYTGGGSVLKSFDNAFVTLGGTVYHIQFDHTASLPIDSPFSTSLDGTSYWATGRIGYNVTPQLYVFAESAGIFQRFNNSTFDTNGYRVIGGVGSADPQSLFRGEIFGGYQAQEQIHGSGILLDANGVPLIVSGSGIPSGVPSNTNSAIYGGRLAYYPTRYWTLVAQVDQTLGISTTLSPTLPAGIPLLATNAILQTNYNISRWWWVGARVGYTRSQFYGFDRLDNGWMAGASFNYELWRNLLLTLDYQYSTVHSDAVLSDFTRNVYTAGLTYRY
jgi:Putative beta-barrel porin 2